LRDEDKTKEKQGEHLKAAEEYARSIIDSSIDMIIAVDNDRIITEFNNAAEETFGYRREEVVGKHVDILYADTTEGDSIYKSTVSDMKNLQEVQNQRKNGEVFPCLLSASVLFDSKGNKVGLMGVSRDITEQKRAEEERERLIKELQDALDHIKTMRGLLPICVECKKIRDDEGFWQQVEIYIEGHSTAEFSHGMCPDCMKERYPEAYEKKFGKSTEVEG